MASIITMDSPKSETGFTRPLPAGQNIRLATHISELTEADRPMWDAYVRQSEYGMPQQLSGWRDVLQKTYGYETSYLMATHAAARDGSATPQVVGVLPLFVVRSFLVGRTVTTMPGGLCADDDQIAGELIARAKELAAQVDANRFAVHDTRRIWPADLTTTCGHESWVVDVRMGEDNLWRSLDRNVRRQVRMGQRNKLAVEVDRTGYLVDHFYDVLSQFSHQAGTPVYGRAFLENVVESFPDGTNIVVVYLEGQPIGSYFQLEMGNTNYGVWGATLHEFLGLRPVYLAYWEILTDTIAQGFESLDMGRSPLNSNASKYKGQWSGTSTPVYQQTASLGGGQTGESVATQTQNDARFQRFQQIWPKLPFSVAQYLGPKLRRHVPFA